uniref:Muscarinic acetylcholine receptor n=1 Tax=Denticeps clupeoides TaxID=299321 RepID=A0AAY4BRX2_9TELE
VDTMDIDVLQNTTLTGNTSDAHLVPLTLWEVVTIATVSAIVSLVTVVGNVLVMLSFKVNSQLKTVNNYYLLSLAFADLIIGVFSMNLYTSYIVMGHWSLGNVACDLWLTLDYVASNASVMNLLVISFDRYFSITRPLTYRAKRTPKRAGIMIGMAWLISFILWAPPILCWQYIVGKRTVPPDQCQIQFFSEPVITFGTAIAAFYVPVSIMTILYCRIYKETEKRTKDLDRTQASWSSSNQSNVTKTTEHSDDAWAKVEQNQAQKSNENGQLTCCNDDFYFTPSPRRSSQKGSKNPTTTPTCPLSERMDRSSSPSPSNKPMDPNLKSQITKRKRMVLIKERKAAQTLSAILLAFILTWTPYNIMVLISTFCSDCIPLSLWHLGYWLCYVNSTVNPMCYALCNKTFQKTFKMLLLCKRRKNRGEEKLYWVAK